MNPLPHPPPAREGKMTDRICAWPECGRPLTQRANESLKNYHRRQCCSQQCASKLGHSVKKQTGQSPSSPGGGDPSWRYTGWPRVTGEIDWNGAFAAHNIEPPAEFGIAPPRPDAQSYVGCSAAMLIRASNG